MSSAKKPQARGIFEKAPEQLVEATISANQIAGNKPGINPYEVRNSELIDEEKVRICGENGQPAPARKPRALFARYDAQGKTKESPEAYTFKQLKDDSERDGANHRRTLDRNLRKDGHVRVPDVAAHHIVASGHFDALGSRVMLFRWGIGINDADNGVFLPAWASVLVKSLATATPHDKLHASTRYYFRVERRLRTADQKSQFAGRTALRRMRDEMLQGTFPIV